MPNLLTIESDLCEDATAKPILRITTITIKEGSAKNAFGIDFSVELSASKMLNLDILPTSCPIRYGVGAAILLAENVA